MRRYLTAAALLVVLVVPVGGGAPDVSAVCSRSHTYRDVAKTDSQTVRASADYSNGSGCSTVTLNHEVQRKDCDWTGCSWLNGDDYKVTLASGESITYHRASRTMACGTHRYRHRITSPDNLYTASPELTRSC